MASQARKWLGKLALLGWAILLLVALLLLCDNYLQWPWAFNSDNLYCWDLCGDVVAGRPLAGWHLPGAPYLFPDVLLLLPIRWLTCNAVAGFCAYCFVFYLLLLAVLIWLGRLTGLPWREASRLSSAGLVLLLVTSLAPAYGGRSELLVHAGNHIGAILLGLAAMAFVLRSLQQGLSWPTLGLAVVVGSLGVYSDRLLVVQFLAPAALALLALAALRHVPWRRSAGLIAVLGATALLYAPMRTGFSHFGFHMWPLETDVGKASRLALPTLLGNVWHNLTGQFVLQALLPLHLLAAAVLVIASLRRQRTEESGTGPVGGGLYRPGLLFIALVLLLSPLCTLGSLLWTHRADHQGLYRYVLPCFLLPFLFMGLLLRWLPGGAARAAGAFRLAVFAFAVYQAVGFIPTMSRQQFEGPYPPLVRELDRLAREHGPMRGLAGFWTSRHLTALSRQGVMMNVIGNNGQPWLHTCNADRYLSPDPLDLRVPAFNFIVVADRVAPEEGLLDPGIRPEMIEREYGPPREKIAVDRRQIWLYDEVSNPRLDKFLLGQLAQRLRRAGKPIAPKTPARLSQAKANLSPSQGRRNRILHPGESVEVRFATPLCGAALDVSACWDNRYLLTFYHDERRIGALRVPAVPWTGATYGEGGMQSRLLPLPEALRTQPWNRVVLQPRGDSPHFSIGHFLVWPDAIAALPSPRPTPRRFEAEDLQTTGDAAQLNVTEPSASGGQARHAPSGFTGTLAFGPYTDVPAGRYRATFLLRVGAGPSGRIATLDVRADDATTLLGEHVLTANDLPSSGGYTPVSITFSTDLDLDNVEFRLFPAGTRDLWLDCVDLLPLPAEQ
jgi:hypothetical protein